jgi:cytochrome c biogenesis protein
MAKSKDKNIIDRIWDFLASVKLAIIVFSLIALTSIIGTILEQQASPEKNIQVISKLFGESLAPTLYRIFDALGFMDMYHSWWFVTLLMLFAANLLVCSIDRFPSIWKLVKEPIKPLKEEHFKAIPIKREITLKGKTEKVKETVGSVLRSEGFKYSEASDPGGHQFYWEKGRYSRLGVYITHFSILVILVGALIGIFFGFKGFLNLPEGESFGVAFTKTGELTPAEISERRIIFNALEISGGDVSMAARKLGVEESHLTARMKKLGMMPLGFSIRCDDFDVSFYGRSDMPKEYSSLLTVIDNGKEVLKKRIEVNDPLRYKGITFYQSSYGIMPDSSSFLFIFRTTSKTGVSETLRVRQGEKFLIPGTNIEATVTDWSPALSFDKDGRAFTYSEMMNNPGAQLEINENGKTYKKWILERYPVTWRLQNGHIVELVDIWGAQYTGLQVRRDPGVWIVYLGCATMSVGLFIAFFMSHRRLWVRVTTEKGNTKVMVAASANKNREAFERKIDKMVALLKEGGK